MTAAHGRMAGGRGGDRDGLSLPAAKARLKAASSRMTARWQANARFLEPGKEIADLPNRDTIIKKVRNGRGP